MSRRYLDVVAEAAREPVALIGGWGIYFTVTSNYVRVFGRDYAFSRDIDLGFHIDPGWSAQQIKRSSMGRTVRALVARGFVGEGFRLRMDFRIDGTGPLAPEEAKALPSYELASLYVDPMVDYPHPLLRDALGFTPAEELELAPVFSGTGKRRFARVAGKLRIPPRDVLLRMKLKSMPGRSADHKVQKDVADVFALLATHGGGPAALGAAVGDAAFAAPFMSRVGTMTRADWAAVVSATGAPEQRVRTVLAALAVRVPPTEEDRARAKARVRELARWGAGIRSRYLEQKRSWDDTAAAGAWGAYLGGAAAEAFGVSKRTGKKWGRRLATQRTPWTESPPFLSLNADLEEWLRAVKEWAETHDLAAQPGSRRAPPGALPRRYQQILEVQTLRAKVGRGLALLQWAEERGVVPGPKKP